MTTLAALIRRLDRLEEHRSTAPDVIGLALAAVSDEDLDILQEAAELGACGHSISEIATILAERWPLYQKAAERFREAIERIAHEVNYP